MSKKITKRYEKQLKKLKKAQFQILIWGPGANNLHFEKRMKIKSELKKEFKNCRFFFSEDQELDNIFEDVDRSYKYLAQHMKENFQLSVFDICIVLDASQGAGEEISYALANPNNRPKLFILTHEKYKSSNSFCGQNRGHFNQQFYTESEYKECNLVERAKAHIYTKAAEKLLYV